MIDYHFELDKNPNKKFMERTTWGKSLCLRGKFPLFNSQTKLQFLIPATSSSREAGWSKSSSVCYKDLSCLVYQGQCPQGRILEA